MTGSIDMFPQGFIDYMFEQPRYVDPATGIWDGWRDAMAHYGPPMWELIGEAEGKSWDLDGDLHILPHTPLP